MKTPPSIQSTGEFEQQHVQGLNVPVDSSVSDNLAVKAKGRGRG